MEENYYYQCIVIIKMILIIIIYTEKMDKYSISLLELRRILRSNFKVSTNLGIMRTLRESEHTP